MNLIELIDRPHSSVMQQSEAFFIIKQYIKARKGKDITPAIDTRMGAMSAMRDIQIMNNMLVYAICWFRENRSEINKL